MSKLPKPYVKTSDEQLAVIAGFKELPYLEMAEAYKKIVMFFDEEMKREMLRQHDDKIGQIIVEEVSDNLWKLTNVHKHVFFAQLNSSVDMWWYVWSGQGVSEKVSFNGDWPSLKQRICNL